MIHANINITKQIIFMPKCKIKQKAQNTLCLSADQKNVLTRIAVRRAHPHRHTHTFLFTPFLEKCCLTEKGRRMITVLSPVLLCPHFDLVCQKTVVPPPVAAPCLTGSHSQLKKLKKIEILSFLYVFHQITAF